MKGEIVARSGHYDGGIKELIKKLPGFRKYPFEGIADLEKYFSMVEEGRESYAIIVSETDRLKPRFNVHITVNGPIKESAKKVMDDFLGETGMEAEEDSFLEEAFYRLKRISGALDN